MSQGRILFSALSLSACKVPSARRTTKFPQQKHSDGFNGRFPLLYEAKIPILSGAMTWISCITISVTRTLSASQKRCAASLLRLT